MKQLFTLLLLLMVSGISAVTPVLKSDSLAVLQIIPHSSLYTKDFHPRMPLNRHLRITVENGRITKLDLSRIRMDTLTPAIGELTELRELSLKYTRLDTLPAEIEQLQNLTSLDLSSIYLEKLPEEIGALKKLTSLDLSNNKLTALPESFRTLTNLTTLNVNGNKLATFPPEICALTNLTSLSMTGNTLQSLPEEIGYLTELREINLHYNQLKRIPRQFSSLKKLKRVNLSTNKLTQFPIALIPLKEVTFLDLGNNDIAIPITDSISGMVSLDTLELTNNKFRSFPLEKAELRNLRYLDLSNCRIETVPPEIAALTSLTYLNLRYNKLTYIPDEIYELKVLSKADFRDNLIEEIPVGALKYHPSLDTLYLRSNRFRRPPPRSIRQMDHYRYKPYRNEVIFLPIQVGAGYHRSEVSAFQFNFHTGLRFKLSKRAIYNKSPIYKRELFTYTPLLLGYVRQHGKSHSLSTNLFSLGADIGFFQRAVISPSLRGAFLAGRSSVGERVIGGSATLNFRFTDTPFSLESSYFYLNDEPSFSAAVQVDLAWLLVNSLF